MAGYVKGSVDHSNAIKTRLVYINKQLKSHDISMEKRWALRKEQQCLMQKLGVQYFNHENG